MGSGGSAASGHRPHRVRGRGLGPRRQGSRVGRIHGLQPTTTSTRKDMADMESRAKLAGHAIHPMLITLPLGLLGTAVIFDIIRTFTDEADLAVASFYMLAAGILGGLLAAVFGLVDLLAIPAGTRPRASGRCMGSATWSWWPCLPSAGYYAAARPTTSRRALPSGSGWLRWCWRW